MEDLTGALRRNGSEQGMVGAQAGQLPLNSSPEV